MEGRMFTLTHNSFVRRIATTALVVALLFAVLVTPASAANTPATPPNSNSNSNFNATPQNAYASDNAYAVATGGDQGARYYTTLGYGIPAGATIDGIVVSLEGNRTGGRNFRVDLTWNNNTFQTAITQPTAFGGTDSTVLVGSPTTTSVWGTHVWTPAEINSTNFRVRVTSFGNGGTISLDQLLVTIYYTLPKTPTTTTLTSSLNPSNQGDSVTFTATVAPAAATGTVTFQDGGTTIPGGALIPLVGGVATFTTTALTGGAHTITAEYSGDATYAGSTGTLMQGVNLVPTITNPGPYPLSVNGVVGNALPSLTIRADGFPAPTFNLTGTLPDGVTFNTTTGVLSGTPTLGTNAVGVYNLTVTASNSNGTSAPVDIRLTVTLRPQNITFNPPGTATYGSTFTVNPTSNSGLTVIVTVVSGSCSIAGNVVTVTGITNCVLAANQAGNADYDAAAEVRRTVTINKAAATVSVDPAPHTADAPSQSFYSHPMTFTVTVTSANGTPTGSVTLTGGTPAQNITVPLVNGVAQITTSNLSVLYSGGIYFAHGGNAVACWLAGVACPGLVVTYGGDANFNTDTEQVSHIVYPAPTQVNVTSDINPSAEGQQVTFTVTVSTTPPGTGTPPGTVTLWDGTTQLTTVPITLTNGVATFPFSALAYGAHNITARFTSTSSNYASNSTSNTYVQNVGRSTTTTLTSNNNASTYGQNVTFTATVTSGTPGTINGTVRFYNGATLLGTGTIAGGQATFTTNALIVGTHPITATYIPAVGSIFSTSTSAVLNQVVNKATITVTADNQTIVYGDADPSPLTFTYSGFVLGDTTIITAPTCDASGTPHVNVGFYPGIIVCSGAADDNYTFTYVNGNMTVTQKPLTITADNQGKIYNTVFTFAGTEFSANGLIFGDTVTSVTLNSAGAAQLAPVNTYPIVPSAAVGTGLGNYAITYVNGTMTVIPSTSELLVITANDQTKVYGNTFTFTGNEFTVTGLVGGDTVTSVTFTTSGTPPATNSAAVVGSYTIVPSAAVGTGLGNYTIIYRNGGMVVTPRNLTYTPNNQTKVYGNVFSAYTGAFTGLRPGDNITPIFDSAGAALATAPVGVYPITVTLDDPDGRLGNYTVADPLPTATLTVTRRPLTITANNQTKVYGDVFTFTGTEFTTGVNQLVNGDAVDSVTLTSTGAPAAATVALSPYPIVPNAAVAAVGTNLNNYAITYVNGLMTVTKPTLTVTSFNQTKTYGDVFTFTASDGSVVGLQNGDIITPTLNSAGALANANIGSYDITVLPLVDPGNKLSNYNVVYNIGKLTVQRRDLTVVANDLTKIYGDTITLTGVMTGSILAGDGITFTYSSQGVPATAPVGPYAIAITLNDPNGRIGNYNYSLTPATLTVTLRDLVVITDNKSKQYGTWFFAFTGSFTGIQNGDNITANYASEGSLPSAAVGPYPITATLNDPTGKLGNYNVINNFGTLTVGSSTLTVTADNKTITYGDPEPAFTFTYSGFAAGDDPSVIDTPPTCTVTGAHTAYGTYQINCSGGVDNAYTFAYLPGTLTINRRPLVATPIDKTKIYGDVFPTANFTGTLTGVQAGDVITPTYASTGAPATAAIGNHDITVTLAAAPGVLDNYTVTLNTGTLTVTPRALTVTPADKTKIYGDVFTAFTGTVTGIQNGDPITVTYDSPGALATATVAGSPYTITATVNAPAGVLANYSLTVNTGSLTVTLRPLMVTPDNKAKAFGTVFPVANFTGTVTGALASDNLIVSYDSTGAPAAAPAGIYDITAAFAPNPRLANYTQTLNIGKLTVGSNILTVTANNQTKTYGEPDPLFTFTYSGFQGTDGPGVLTTQPTCQVLPAHNAVGPFPITCSGGEDENYIFSYVPATLTVTSRDLTVTPANQTKIYGDTFTAFTGTVTGLQASDGITVTYSSTGAVATATVAGSPYQIIATLNDPNNRLGNYTLTNNTGTLTVTRRPLVATPDNKNKVYGDVFTAFTGTITGIQNGNPITATYASTGAPAAAAVGPYSITATLNDPGGFLPNYAVTLNTGTLTVTRRDLVVTPADKTKIYGDVFTAFTGTITGIQNADPITAAYASPGAAANATVAGSPYTITATLVDPANRAGNYNVILNTGTLTVTPRSLTVTPDNKAKVFGTTFTAFTGVVFGLQPFDPITVTYDSPGAINTAPVETYPINATLNDPTGRLANYTVTLNTGTLTVGYTVLTVTANNQIKTYGDTDPVFTFTYSGFLGTDGPGVLTTEPTCQVLPAHNAVGTFPITCSGGIDDNYIFSYVAGTLTVTPRPLVVTPDNKSKIYGDTFTAFTGVVTGIQPSDSITVTYASAGAAATATVAGSPYTITATLNDPNTRLGNYTVTLNTGTLTVTQRPLVATSDDKNKAYGTVFTAFTGSVVGIQNNDNITPTYASTGAPAAAVAGPYPITITLNDPNNRLPNYAVTYNIGTLTVGGNTLVVTPADKIKPYGTVFTAFTGTIVGLQPGDNITATYASTGAAANAAVGAYDITATLVDPDNRLPNYTVTLNTGTLTVSLADQTITVTNHASASAMVNSSFTVAATASSGLPVTYSASGACTNVGATFTMANTSGICTVHFNQAGNANYNPASEVTEPTLVLLTGQAITVTQHAPAVSSLGNSFDVAATASSGLTVSISGSGGCNIDDHDDGTATIAITSATSATCRLQFNQPGNATFPPAPQVTERVALDSTHSAVTVNQGAAQADPTNVSPINFTVVFSKPVTGFTNADVTIGGTAGATTATLTEVAPNDGTTYNVAISGMTRDGTVTVSIPADAAQDIAGNGNTASTSTDNTVTYLDAIGPMVQGISTINDTGDGSLGEGEAAGVNITQFTVTFNQPVYDPPGSSNKDDVTNPNNYLLVRDRGDTPGFQTVNCSSGVATPADTQIPIGSVTYANNTATFSVNGGQPLPNGTYRLFVCGSTSIVDPLNNALKLVGVNGAGTDFIRNFSVLIVPPEITPPEITPGSTSFIPVTGFAPGVVTTLPVQPLAEAYSDLGDLWLEIPHLGVQISIVGIPRKNGNWDVSWLSNQAGYLDGSAYPTSTGNSVMTAHVYLSNGKPGPFVNLSTLIWGDEIIIHASGKQYVYQVQAVTQVKPDAVSTMLKHEDASWLTLVTCKGYNPTTGGYQYRILVRAVLIKVK
jgi:LPXTG-site transpeptidase (sortase) family protein